MPNRIQVAFVGLIVSLVGCTESAGISYSSLPVVIDEEIQSAENRWSSLLDSDPKKTAAEKTSDASRKNEGVDENASAKDGSLSVLKTADDSVATSEALSTRLVALDRSDEEQFKIAEREPKLLIPTKSFFKDRRSGTYRVGYDDIDLLKILNMEPVPVDAAQMFPDWLNGLNGKRIRIRGWMFPPPLETGLTGFLFVRDNGICCFQRRPKVYDMIEVKMRENTTTSFVSGRPVDVEGVFRIEPNIEFGELYRLYFIDDAIVVER